MLSEHSVNSRWVQKEVETAFDKENRESKLVLFPVRLDDAVMATDKAWAADIRRMRHIRGLLTTGRTTTPTSTHLTGCCAICSRLSQANRVCYSPFAAVIRNVSSDSRDRRTMANEEHLAILSKASKSGTSGEGTP